MRKKAHINFLANTQQKLEKRLNFRQPRGSIRAMKKLPYACFSCLLVCLMLSRVVSPEEGRDKVLKLKEAESGQSLGQVLFSPDGSLYVAYRLREQNKRSGILRVVKFDSSKGEAKASADFPVPQVHLPRVATEFIQNQDASLLVYAELHSPSVVLTIDAATLKPISRSTTTPFSKYDMAVHIEDFNSHSLILSAEKPTRRRPITIESIHEIVLNPSDLSQVISDKKVAVGDRATELQTWMKRSRKDLSFVVPLEEGALAFTDLKTQGDIAVLDSDGKATASLPMKDCGVTKAAVTSDRQYVLAVCESPVRNELHHQIGCLRKAVVVEVSGLKILRSLPMSNLTLKEQGMETDELWSESPSPAIWRNQDELLVAIPDSSSNIKLYSVFLSRQKRTGQ